MVFILSWIWENSYIFWNGEIVITKIILKEITDVNQDTVITKTSRHRRGKYKHTFWKYSFYDSISWKNVKGTLVFINRKANQ